MTGLFARFGGFDVGTSTSFASSSAAVVLGAKVCIGVGELKSHHVFGDTHVSVVGAS